MRIDNIVLRSITLREGLYIEEAYTFLRQGHRNSDMDVCWDYVTFDKPERNGYTKRIDYAVNSEKKEYRLLSTAESFHVGRKVD